MSKEFEERVVFLLEELLKETQILTEKDKKFTEKRFRQDFLLTSLRGRMYDLFDGQRDTSQISKESGASLRSVQLFIQELVSLDLIKTVKQANSTIPSQDLLRIHRYYSRQTNEGDNNNGN